MALEFSAESEARIKAALEDGHTAQSALLPVLYVAQDQFGYLSDDVLNLVSERLQLPRQHLDGVATFYTMYKRERVGRYHIQVCRTLSCSLMGAEGIVEHVEKKLGIKPGEVTEDGKFSLEEVECLALCDGAPAMQVNHDNYLNLTPEKLDQILDGLE